MSNSQVMPTTESSDRAGVVAVIVRDARLLVIRRSRIVRSPGKYCFPGGGVEPGESETDALRREVREELDVPVEPIRRLWRSVTPSGVRLAWWAAELTTDAVPVAAPAEVESFCWLTVEQMLALRELLESNRQFLAAWGRNEFRLDGIGSGSIGCGG